MKAWLIILAIAMLAMAVGLVWRKMRYMGHMEEDDAIIPQAKVTGIFRDQETGRTVTVVFEDGSRFVCRPLRPPFRKQTDIGRENYKVVERALEVHDALVETPEP